MSAAAGYASPLIGHRVCHLLSCGKPRGTSRQELARLNTMLKEAVSKQGRFHWDWLARGAVLCHKERLKPLRKSKSIH